MKSKGGKKKLTGLQGFGKWGTSTVERDRLYKAKPVHTGPRRKGNYQYQYTPEQIARLQGRKDHFIFPIKEEILWIDELTKGGFDSRHYSPLVYEEIPELKRGTILYDDFWDEHDKRCLEGYQPIINGVVYPRITGMHYFYLNMFRILMLHIGERRKRLGYPYYRVLDHMLFLELEKAGKDGYGIIVGKARRMGLSYVGALVMLYNLLFFRDNTVAVGAGLEDKAKGLYDKIVKAMENIRPEYSVTYRKQQKILKLCYDVTVNKVKTDHGVNSVLDVRTFFNNPSAFEGGSYSFFIFEEIGLQDNLILSYKASEPCFMEGRIQFGVPFLFGTGGEVDKGSKGFSIMYGNPSAYNLKKLFIPAYMYYPGSVSADDMDEDQDKEDVDEMDVGANFFDPRTGMTNEELALKHILKRRAQARKSKDGYIKEVQSRPIKESDLFLKTSGGLLNRLALSAQREAIYNKENGRTYTQGRYEWQDTEDIRPLLSRCSNTKEKAKLRMKYGIKVKFVPDPNGTAYVIDGVKPINTDGLPYKPDIQATDSYDDEGVAESGSMGASLVYRCFSGLSLEYDYVIAFIHERGDGTSEDTFFENTLMQSVYWNAENLVEYTKIAILNYYKDVNAWKYLRKNPDINKNVVTNNGRQEYGVRMTSGKNGFKSLVTTLLKLEVKDNVQNMHFEKVIDDLIDYGDVNTDIAMAYGVCLIHKLDIFDFITDDLDDIDGEADILMDMAYYSLDSSGNVTVEAYGGTKNDDLFQSLEVFDPRKHLDGEDREKYLMYMEAKRTKIQKERDKKERDFIEADNEIVDPFKSTIDEYRNTFK